MDELVASVEEMRGMLNWIAQVMTPTSGNRSTSSAQHGGRRSAASSNRGSPFPDRASFARAT